mgnify:FL=1
MDIEYNGQLIKVEKCVLRKRYENRQKEEGQNETGGMIIGYRLKSNNALVINDITLPTKNDSQSTFNFIRSEDHNVVLEEKWKESQMTIMYMGEWHTHLTQNPNYSITDILSWKKLMKRAITETDILLFFIIGSEKYKIWVGDRRNKRIQMIYEGGWSIDE